MKKKIYFLFLILLPLLGSSCGDVMNPTPLIDINPKFDNAGFISTTIISQNESDVYNVKYSRDYGISRELTMTLTVDETALAEYNQENGTDYKLLASEFYSMPSDVKFEVKSKDASFDVTIYSKKLFESAGSIESATKYVIPVKATTDVEKGVDAKQESNTILIHINMGASTITPSVPNDPINIYFVVDTDITEEVSLQGMMNFSGVDKSKISITIDENDPKLSSGDFELLPNTNYSFQTADVSGSNISVSGAINSKDLQENVTYLLPCYFHSSDAKYVVNQSSAIYYQINISDLKISIKDADKGEPVAAYSSIATIEGNVEVSTNTMVIGEELIVNFTYEPTLIDQYNTDNNTAYLTLPDGVVEITNSSIQDGAKDAKVGYKIDISSLTLSDGKHYLVPLAIDKEALGLALVEGPDVIYLDVTKTLVGEYNLDVIVNQRTRNIQNTVWYAKDNQRGEAWDEVANLAQYGFGGDGDYYAVLFSVTDEDMPDKANCKKIELFTFLELIVPYGGSNDVLNNKSYFNTVTGEIYIDCTVFESWFEENYKETYSFTRK